MSPQRSPHHNSRTCDYVSLHGKRVFVGGIKLRLLGWNMILNYLGGPNVINHQGYYKRVVGEVRFRQRRCEDKNRGWSNVRPPPPASGRNAALTIP